MAKVVFSITETQSAVLALLYRAAGVAIINVRDARIVEALRDKGLVELVDEAPALTARGRLAAELLA